MLSNKGISFRNLTFLLISVVFWVALVIYYNSSVSLNNKLVVFSIILNILNIVLIFQTHKIPTMLIFSIFIYNYSYIFTIPAFFPYTKISGVGNYNNNDLLLLVLFQLLIGMFALNYLFFINKEKFIQNRFLCDNFDEFNMRKNNLIYIFGIIGYLFFLLLNNSGKQYNLPFSITFEYILIFIILVKLFSENNLINKIIIHIMIVLVCIKTLVYSGRIEVVESLLLLFIFYYEKKIKALWIIIGSFSLNIFMEYLFIARNTAGDSNWQTSKIFFDRSNPPTLILGNEGDVTQSSMAMVGVIQDNTVSFAQRIDSFFDMIFSQFFPVGSIELFQGSNVSRYIQEFAVTLGGGYIYSQWYFWLGIFGVILASILINKVIKLAYFEKKRIIITITCIYSIVLFSRWYAYFFDFLIKIPFLLFILLIIFKMLYPKREKNNV
ncbi:hypothetical protein [Niallia alba]|uniref:Oligosaccharide repeat unit polymerase n=1 Tax=Niallia alba TaxID=2729105 RepID=A0A7Y0PPL7_9BACI|nr:hypothetical protein [Niallia alba]NMO79576.1 hypothetical protein [Niallia alba]